jgi:hypothetical protein
MTAVPAMTSCRARRRFPGGCRRTPAPGTGSSAERQRPHDRPAPARVGAIVAHDPHAEQRYAGRPAARGPGNAFTTGRQCPSSRPAGPKDPRPGGEAARSRSSAGYPELDARRAGYVLGRRHPAGRNDADGRHRDQRSAMPGQATGPPALPSLAMIPRWACPKRRPWAARSPGRSRPRVTVCSARDAACSVR